MGSASRVAAVLLVACVAATPSASAATVKKAPAPRGVKLAPKDLKRVGLATCGRIAYKWYPGTLTKAGRFLTLTVQASTAKQAAKGLKGAKRKQKLAVAARYTKRSATYLPYCRARLAPIPAPGSVPPPPVINGYYGGFFVPPNTDPVRIDLRGAVGVASRPRDYSAPPTPASSNLSVVDTAGRLRGAVTSGSVDVGKFLIAPNGKLYVLFSTPVPLEGAASTGTCLLAEVTAASTQPTCIDGSLGSVQWNPGAANPAIQFDAAGAIYYLGTAFDGRLVLRRSSNGVVTDLITDQAYASDFLVLPDGTVVLTGTTTATSAQWTRRLSPAGSLKTLRPAQSTFIKRFPDGNVYFGQGYASSPGVQRYRTASDDVDPRNWIGSDYSEPAPRFSGSNLDSYGASILNAFTTPGGKVLVISGYAPNGRLVQYYPTLEQPVTAVKRVTVAQGVISNVLLSGLDADSRNITTLYDSTDGTERELIGADEETEIYHLNYVAAGNKVLFDGLRFADNTYVLGQIDLSSGEVTVTSTIPGRFDGFETFR